MWAEVLQRHFTKEDKWMAKRTCKGVQNHQSLGKGKLKLHCDAAQVLKWVKKSKMTKLSACEDTESN